MVVRVWRILDTGLRLTVLRRTKQTMSSGGLPKARGIRMKMLRPAMTSAPHRFRSAQQQGGKTLAAKLVEVTHSLDLLLGYLIFAFERF